MRDSATSYLFSMIDVRLFWVCMDVEKTMTHAPSAILKLTTNGPHRCFRAAGFIL
jgi:hypothetical protein